jgi:hypothetical protein
MRKVEEIERQISELSNEEFAELCSWIVERDAAAWDGQIETHVANGKLIGLGDTTRRARAEGKSTKL